MSLPNPRLREHFAKIRADGTKKKMNEARIPILMYLIMAANTRLRAWHGVDTIMTDTGYSKSVVTDVLSYLQSVGAMYNVPIEHRVGQEKTIHGNRKVWQMTGIMAIGSEIIDYLYIKDSDRTSAYQEIAEHAPDEVKALYARLGAIDLGSQNEPILTEEISSQNEPKVIQFGSQNGLEIGSQNGTAKEVNTIKRIKQQQNTSSSVVVVKSVAEPNIDPAYSHVMLAIQGLEMLNDKLRYAVKDWLKEYSEGEILKAIDTAIENRRNGTKIKSVPGYITGTLANQRREAAEQKQAEQARPALVPYVPEPPISEEERQKAIAIMAERRKNLSTSTNTGGLYGTSKAAGE